MSDTTTCRQCDPGTRVSRGEASLWITAALEHKLIGDSDDNA